MAKQVLPSQRSVVSCYDNNGRIVWASKDRTEAECISGNPGPQTTWYGNVTAYAPHGGMRSVTLGNALVESMTFDNRLQMGEVALGAGGAVWKLAKNIRARG